MPATLIAHVDSYKCDLSAVRKIKAPEPTDTWMPISHGDLIDMMLERLKAQKITVDKETSEYALAKNGNRMFATFNLRSEERKDFTLALGLRNSIDKSLSAGICCGSRVFVCDNLAFSSDIVFKERHHANFLEVMPGIIDEALNKFTNDGKAQEKLFNRMKKLEIDLEAAMDALAIMADDDHKLIQKPQLFGILSEFRKPRFDEFAALPRSAWTFMNACTTYCRHDRIRIDPQKAQDNLLGIHKVITDRFALAN